MKPDRSLVRASDIGLWATCNRAWWLAQIKGVSHRNPALLEHGAKVHAAHGAQVAQAGALQRAGLILVAAALMLAGLLLLVLMIAR